MLSPDGGVAGWLLSILLKVVSKSKAYRYVNLRVVMVMPFNGSTDSFSSVTLNTVSNRDNPR